MHAGHGLDYASAETIAALPEIVELNIGHFLIGEAVFVGLDNAIRAMRDAMDRGRRRSAGRMILGLGSDLVDIRRIEKVLARHGDRFIQRIFTPIEIAKAERRATRIDTYAKRFAAKEACSKALGTGFRKGVFFRDLGRREFAFRTPHHGADRRRAGAAAGDHARGLRGPNRTSA